MKMTPNLPDESRTRGAGKKPAGSRKTPAPKEATHCGLTEEDLDQKVVKILVRAAPLIREIEKMRRSRLLVLVSTRPIDDWTVYRLNKMLRKERKFDNVDVMLESGGGYGSAAVGVAKLLQKHVKEGGRLSTLIPFHAKSAATLLALYSQEIVMCEAGELGPVDSQISEPMTWSHVSVHAIKDMVDFLGGVKDTNFRKQLVDKVSPLALGLYQQEVNSTRLYLKEALAPLGAKGETAIQKFMEEFPSHGYPIDRTMCRKWGLHVRYPSRLLEDKIADLHDLFGDMLLEMALDRAASWAVERDVGILVIYMRGMDPCIIIKSNDISREIGGVLQSRNAHDGVSGGGISVGRKRVGRKVGAMARQPKEVR